MSTLKNGRLEELRAKAFPYLRGSDFFDVLAEARQYHKAHPPGEMLVLRDPETVDSTAEEFIKVTIQNHARAHRERVMMPFLRKNVPYNLAGEIVDEFVLADTKAKPAG